MSMRQWQGKQPNETPKGYALRLEGIAHLQQAFDGSFPVRVSQQEDHADGGNIIRVEITLPSSSLVDAEERLRAFDASWWLQHCGESEAALVFDYAIADGGEM